MLLGFQKRWALFLPISAFILFCGFLLFHEAKGESATETVT